MKRSLARGGTLLLAGALSVPSLLAALQMTDARAVAEGLAAFFRSPRR